MNDPGPGRDRDTGDAEDVESLLVACLEAHDRGDHAAVEETCQRHPEKAHLIRAALATLHGETIGQAGSGPAVKGLPPSLPDVLGDFEIVGEIGRGGMGVVFEARQRSLGRRVALKVLPPFLTLDQRAVLRFQREGQAAARLQHPGLVPIYAVGEDQGCHWYAMEYVVGAGLDRVLLRLRDRSLRRITGADVSDALRAGLQQHASARSASSAASSATTRADPWARGFVPTMVSLAAQLAEALAAAHSQGVVHRDVKPSNVLLRPDGTAVLVDFGLALVDAAPGLTRSGGFLGTPYYMAPEQAEDASAADARSDVFALGTVLYEMVTLQRAFDGRSDAEVLRQVGDHEPLPPQRLNPEVPPDLQAVIQKAMEKEPQRRYPTAAALADDLRALLRHEPVKARQITTVGHLRRWARREPWKAALAMLLTVGVPTVVGLGGVLWARRPLVALAEAALREEQIELALAQGIQALFDGRSAAGLERLGEARRLAPERAELAALEVYALSRARRRTEARARIDGWTLPLPRPETLGRIEAACWAVDGDLAAADRIEQDLPDPEGVVELTMAALAAVARTKDRMDFPALRRAQAWLQQALFLSPHPRLDLLIALSHVLHYTEDAALARAVDVAIAEHWPEGPGTLLARANVSQQFDVRASLDLYQRALAAGADRASVYIGMSQASEALKDLRRGIELLDKVPTDDPRYSTALYNRGRLRFFSGDIDGAGVDYEESLRLSPDMVSAAVGVGIVRNRKKDIDGVLEVLGRFVDRFPGVTILQNNYADALMAKARDAEALPYLERALVLEPEGDYLIQSKSMALARLGRVSDALSLLMEAVGRHPEKAFRWRMLALLHMDTEEFPQRDLQLAEEALRRGRILSEGQQVQYNYRADLCRLWQMRGNYTELRRELDTLLPEIRVMAAKDQRFDSFVINLEKLDAHCREKGY